MVNLNTLNPNQLYILSVLPYTKSKHKNYTWFIKKITTYLNKVNRSNIKELTTHTAWLLNYNNKWFTCEISFNGRVHRLFGFDKQTKYYVSQIEVNPKYLNEVKLDLLEKYAKRDVNTFFTKVIASAWNYPIFKAIKSVELPSNKIYFIIINKIADLCSDIAEMIRRLLGIEKEFCTEAVIADLCEYYLKQYITIIPPKLTTFLVENKFAFDEIYPQNILETTNYIELIDN